MKQTNNTEQMSKSKNHTTTLHPAIANNMKLGTPIFTTMNNHKRDKSKYDYLRLVSWNVNMNALSAYTPNGWDRFNNKWDEIYKQVESQKADIITFQEITTPYFAQSDDKSIMNKYNRSSPLIQKYIDSNNWFITNSTRSHCGNTLILINKRVKYEYGFDINYNHDIDPLGKWPAVILSKKVIKKNEEKTNDKESEFEYKKLMLFGAHLMYGNNGSYKRKLSFDRLYKLSQKQNMQNNFVLIGDTNMRDYDEKEILNKYDDISSCWDYKIKSEHLKLNNFMATFYRNFFEIGKQGTTRYDKIFCGKNVRCISFGIFDKSVSPNVPFHFLSDHRGIVADLEI